jgi:hypothetical protein
MLMQWCYRREVISFFSSRGLNRNCGFSWMRVARLLPEPWILNGCARRKTRPPSHTRLWRFGVYNKKRSVSPRNLVRYSVGDPSFDPTNPTVAVQPNVRDMSGVLLAVFLAGQSAQITLLDFQRSKLWRIYHGVDPWWSPIHFVIPPGARRRTSWLRQNSRTLDCL